MSTPNGTGNDGTDFEDESAGLQTVYELAPQCTLDDVEEGKRYLATVNGIVDYGIFVDLSQEVSGLVHTSNLVGTHDVGDELIVELVDVRSDGDLSFAEVQMANYDTEPVGPGPHVSAHEFGDYVGQHVHLEGQVVQIKQTGGPTIFQLRTADGVVPCAAFEEAGVRAYPEVELDDIVRVVGTVESREDYTQLETDDVEVLDADIREQVHERLHDSRSDLVDPAPIEPLAEWSAFGKFSADLEDVARRLRETVLSGRPIRIRHHADGDGLCASVPLQYALERFIADTWEDPEAPRHLLKRLPSKAPFYELEDVTRDLNFALENRKRHGQKLPLFLMLDNGSTEEDTPAYRNLKHYDVPILVVDHHHPDPEAVEGLVEKHVNPYLHDEDYRITTGMMCVEIARMIDPSITDEVRHVPAVAGLSDRSEADAMETYIDLASEEGYDERRLVDIGEALDYATYWLKYNAGRELVNDLLNVNCDDRERHEQVVDLFVERAARDVDAQLDAAMQHVTHEDLDNGAHLYRIDVERHAKRFTYPAPGKTTGKIHDRKVEETGDPVITIGFGPDFAVLRSDGVRLDIPEMVAELKDELPGGGVSGGGHLVVGSIKFVTGMREEVIDTLVEKMADAEIDEELGSSAVLPEEN
jgi:RecJ-like exonuclease